MENKYQRAKIYLIRSDQSGLPPYYGSTTSSLSQRIGEHRSKMRRYDNGKPVRKCAAFQLLRFPDARIILVEDFPCERREQLLAREDWYIRSRECINKINALRSVEDQRVSKRAWYEANLDKKRKYDRAWREANHDKVRESKRAWREANHDKMRETDRAYKSIRITCAICSAEVRQGDIKRHQRTFKCKQSQPLFIPDGENTIDLSRDTTPLNV